MDRTSVESGSIESLDFEDYQSRLRASMLHHQDQELPSPSYRSPNTAYEPYEDTNFSNHGSQHYNDAYDSPPPRTFLPFRTTSPLSRITEVETPSPSSQASHRSHRTARPRSILSRNSYPVRQEASPSPRSPPPRLSTSPTSYHAPTLPTPPSSPTPTKNSGSASSGRSRVSFSSLPPLPRSPLNSQYSAENVQDIPMRPSSSSRSRSGGAYSSSGGRAQHSHQSSPNGDAASGSSGGSGGKRSRSLPPWLMPVDEEGDPTGVGSPTPSRPGEVSRKAQLPRVNFEEHIYQNAAAGHSRASLHHPEPGTEAEEEEKASHPMFEPTANEYSFRDEPVPPNVKEERVRMLEAVFDGTVRTTPDDGVSTKTGGTEVVPTVFGLARGTVVFRDDGRKKRIWTRWLQFLCAWSAAVACIYGAIFTHASSTPNPLKCSYKWETYLLDGLAVISALLTLYYFFLRRYKFFRHLGGNLTSCCRSRGKNTAKKNSGGRRGGARGKKGGKKGGGRSSSRAARLDLDSDSDLDSLFDSDSEDEEDRHNKKDVQVNLVVDPRYFENSLNGSSGGPLLSPPPALSSAHGGFPFSQDDDGTLAWNDDPRSRVSAPFPAAAQRSHPPSFKDSLSTAAETPLYSYPSPSPYPYPYHYPYSGYPGYPGTPSKPPQLGRKTRLRQRHVAQTNLHTLTGLILLDIFFMLTWIGLFFYLLLRSKATKDGSAYCVAGGSNGWCNAYNTTRAAGFLLGLLSVGAIVLDWKDRGAMNAIVTASSGKKKGKKGNQV